MRKGIFRMLPVLMLVIQLASCSDNAIIDTSTVITNRNWSYINKITVPVKIMDASKKYDIYLNLRHTTDYNYSNIFVLVHQSGPGIVRTNERMEFQLAFPDGEWLGSGSGNIYSYQLPVKENYTFPAAGTYVFEVEQNMRDNPLKGISDIGLRVEPVN